MKIKIQFDILYLYTKKWKKNIFGQHWPFWGQFWPFGEFGLQLTKSTNFDEKQKNWCRNLDVQKNVQPCATYNLENVKLHTFSFSEKKIVVANCGVFFNLKSKKVLFQDLAAILNSSSHAILRPIMTATSKSTDLGEN